MTPSLYQDGDDKWYWSIHDRYNNLVATGGPYDTEDEAYEECNATLQHLE